MRRSALAGSIGALAASLASVPAAALTVVIGNASPEIALRVGATGGTISLVTFTVTGATAASGVPIAGTTNAAAGSAQAPNFATACAANNVLVWARARSTLPAPRTATLSVNASGGLASGANTIPFTDFDWITSGGAEIPSGGFSGAATQNLLSFNTSREISVCLGFRFLNTTVYPAGTYNGQLLYTLQMP